MSGNPARGSGPADHAWAGGWPVPGRGQPVADQMFDGESLAALRSVLSAGLAAAGLPPLLAGDVVLAVHELAANAVRHGAGRGRVRVWREDGALRCEVSDDGPPAGAGAWSSGRGHGLWLVSQLGGQVHVRSGLAGTVVTVIFALP